LHPASASVGPDNEKSALRNSPYFFEDDLISTIAITMFAPTMVMLALLPKTIYMIEISKERSKLGAQIWRTQHDDPQEFAIEKCMRSKKYFEMHPRYWGFPNTYGRNSTLCGSCFACHSKHDATPNARIWFAMPNNIDLGALLGSSR
jgi:hypothetical protein